MIDTFTVRHISGPCRTVPFRTGHKDWANRQPFWIVTGEKIEVTLFGHGADLANGDSGRGIWEWRTNHGTTTNYPGVPTILGAKVPKGFVTICIEANETHGIGIRNVIVQWPTGNEILDIVITSNCTNVRGKSYRVGAPSSGGAIQPPVVGTVPATPNLLPALNTPYVLTRSLGPVVPTPKGDMTLIADFFGAGLPDSVVTEVPVPNLTWGAAGVNIPANTQIDANLVDVTNPNNPNVLATLTLPLGFPANIDRVTMDNYPGRPTTIRVVKNPRFQIGTQKVKRIINHEIKEVDEPVYSTFTGTFTEPGSNQRLDPRALMIVADPANNINEGARENDNELRF